MLQTATTRTPTRTRILTSRHGRGDGSTQPPTERSVPADATPVATFRGIGTTHRILATDARALPQAEAIARRHLADLDAAASRFRADSEVSRLARDAAAADARAVVSPLLADYLRAAIHAARLTDGLVDFTVGRALEAAGYDLDLDDVRARVTPVALRRPPGRPGASARTAAAVPGWSRVTLDEQTRLVQVPAGTLIDLGASAKAHAADVIARRLTQALPGGFLVDLGGDIATSGEIPPGGWRIGVEGADGGIRQVVALTGQAVATSSTQLRRWATDAGEAHHVIDPRTGCPAPVVWAQVTCVAADALEANAATTAAVILGHAAPDWLAHHRIPARLEAVAASQGADRPARVVRTPGWPA